jgi:hypothetical protein
MRSLDKETFRKTVKRQIREGEARPACSVCGEDDPKVIESHHLLGRNNSDEEIPLCLNHHAMITEEQNKVSPQARSSSASPQQKLGYLLVTIGALLELIGKNLKRIGHEVHK